MRVLLYLYFYFVCFLDNFGIVNNITLREHLRAFKDSFGSGKCLSFEKGLNQGTR